VNGNRKENEGKRKISAPDKKMVDHNLLKRKVEDDSLEDPNKKQTVNSGDVRDLFKSESHPTTEEGFVPTLNKWFAESGFLGLEHLEFKLSTRCNNSLGCFAKKSFELNDVLFSIPQKHTVNIYDILSTPLSTFIIEQSRLYKLLDICTIEFLFWLHMIAERATNKDNIYIQSLSSNSPFLNQWDSNLLSLIEHTNLFKSIQHMDIRIQQYLTFFQHLYQEIPEQAIMMLPPDCFNHPHAFYWAIGHYLSRRYPSQYAIDTNKSTTGIDLSVLKQEDNLGQVGALVPLLDILNHQNDHEYLRYEYNNHNGYLQVICNHPIAQGDELYSNYGILSNEQLLFAYGYALLDNLYDTLPMRLRSLPQLGPGNSTNNVYYLKSGGWDGIPKNLLQSLRRLREQTIIMNGEKTLDTNGNGIAAVAVEEEEVQGEGEGEGEGMEENIDIEDCEIVMNYVMDSLLTMQQCYLQ